MIAKWKSVVVRAETPLGEVIAKVDASGLQVALVLDADDRLLGIVTDGNIRRAILAGKSLQVPVSQVMSAQPFAVSEETSREAMLALMRRRSIHHLPLTDRAGRVVGLATQDALLGAAERPNWVVLMAGGLGTRLQPLTEDCPKPLLPVGGKPILEIILEGFAAQGFKHIFLSVNYKAEMIREHFGAGDRWGVNVEYLHENSRLGTAGALSLLPRPPDEPIIVMNGDLLIQTKFDSLLEFHRAQGAVATMAVREYDVRVPYGVVRLDDARISAIEEKPLVKYFINAGIYVLSPGALEYLPRGTFYDMPSLFSELVARNQTTVAYPLREYWIDVGRLDELERAQREWPSPVQS